MSDDRADQGDYHGEDDRGHEHGEENHEHEHGEEDHGHGEADRPAYDPTSPELPAREPPLRSTAPQSEFTMGQVSRGFTVLAVGLLVTFGLALALV